MSLHGLLKHAGILCQPTQTCHFTVCCGTQVAISGVSAAAAALSDEEVLAAAHRGDVLQGLFAALGHSASEVRKATILALVHISTVRNTHIYFTPTIYHLTFIIHLTSTIYLTSTVSHKQIVAIVLLMMTNALGLLLLY